MHFRRIAPVFAAILIAVVAMMSPARAGLIFTMQEVGPDVVMTGGGTIDLAGLAPGGTLGLTPSIRPNDFFIVGPLASASLFTGALTGPTSIGLGTIAIFASSGAGDKIGLDFVGPPTGIAVPVGYMSGGALSGSATYLGRDFSSLGVTPGTYHWTLANQDTVSLTIGSAAVPEPATLALLSLGLAGLGFSRRRTLN